MTDCWVDTANIIGRGPCGGRLDPAHLIPKQLIRREGYERLAWDQRVWVPICRRHHAALDTARTLRIPREKLPASVEMFAAELDAGLMGRSPFGAYLEREYGPR